VVEQEVRLAELLQEVGEGWPQEPALISSLRRRAAVGTLRVGLLNMEPTTDLGEWKFLAGKNPTTVPMERVADTVRWDDLFPEWLDEEGKYGTPKCPFYPMPKIPPVPYVSAAVHLDVVIARAPCAESTTLQQGWKDPAILQVRKTFQFTNCYLHTIYLLEKSMNICYVGNFHIANRLLCLPP
jgi:hypothetical protein